MTDTVTLEQFISENGITMKAERTDRNPNMADSNMDHWKVSFTRREDGKVAAKMTTYFSMGYGHKGAEPKAADVLDCLASNAASAQDSFEEFCSNLGYDSDLRKAEKIYKACVHGASRLNKFLSSEDKLNQLLYNTERL